MIRLHCEKTDAVGCYVSWDEDAADIAEAEDRAMFLVDDQEADRVRFEAADGDYEFDRDGCTIIEA